MSSESSTAFGGVRIPFCLSTTYPFATSLLYVALCNLMTLPVTSLRIFPLHGVWCVRLTQHWSHKHTLDNQQKQNQHQNQISAYKKASMALQHPTIFAEGSDSRSHKPLYEWANILLTGPCMLVARQGAAKPGRWRCAGLMVPRQRLILCRMPPASFGGHPAPCWPCSSGLLDPE